MSMTLDGYVAGPNDEMDWMQTNDEDWKDLFNELREADTYLLGRKMYPGYSQYWQALLNKPDDGNNEVAFAKLADKTQHIVFTRGDFKPDWKNTRIAHDAQQEISTITKQPGKNIIAWGGATFASHLVNLKLIDELRLVVSPIILGKGKSLFDNIDSAIKLELIKSRQTDGLVIQRYRLK